MASSLIEGVASALVVIWTVVGLNFVAQSRNRKARVLIAWLLAGPVLAAPALVPDSERFARLLLAIYAFAMTGKLIDLQHPRSSSPPAREFLLYMLNPTIMVFRRLEGERMPSPKQNLRRLIIGSLQGLTGLALLIVVFLAHLGRYSFFLDHTAKMVAGYFGVLGGFAAVVSLWRLTLGKARDVFHNIFTARTPAEFWRRYNRIVGQFLHENVFKRAGGLRHPVRATLIAFGASILIHEYVFLMAIGSIQGLQTAFFGIQGVAVALTLRLRPKGALAVACIAGTLLFNLTTGIIFLMSMQQIVPWWDQMPFGLTFP